MIDGHLKDLPNSLVETERGEQNDVRNIEEKKGGKREKGRNRRH